MTLRTVIKSLFIVPLLLVTVQAETPDAAEVVKDTSSKVLERLKAEKSELEQNPGRIYELINKLVLPHFDFTSMSRWVLGREVWTNASEEQRRAFINEFQTLLVRTYAKALLEYSDEEIKYYPAQGKPDSRLVLVKTEVQQPSGSGPIPIHYRMHLNNDHEWKVVDVAVDGVSLVSTYRNSYAAQIRKEGLDALIDKIQERNQQLASNRQAAKESE
jgi:phospholipid transport system substrate-binding protein